MTNPVAEPQCFIEIRNDANSGLDDTGRFDNVLLKFMYSFSKRIEAMFF
jgi:hypothetical protein